MNVIPHNQAIAFTMNVVEAIEMGKKIIVINRFNIQLFPLKNLYNLPE